MIGISFVTNIRNTSVQNNGAGVGGCSTHHAPALLPCILPAPCNVLPKGVTSSAKRAAVRGAARPVGNSGGWLRGDKESPRS